MKKKTLKERRNFYEGIILDGIDYRNLPSEKLQYVWNSFKKEKPSEIKQKGVYIAFHSWLQGLPSATYIPFSSSDIINLYEDANGIKVKSEKEEFKILDNYFNFMMMHYFRLFKKYKVNIEN